MKTISCLFFIFFIVSCSKKEPTLDKFSLMIRINKLDPTAKIVQPKDLNSGIKCSDYGPGCKGGHMAEVQGLDVIFLEFEDVKTAKEDAKRIDGYFLDNWVLDDFAGEPILEKFAEEKLGAIRARTLDPKN